MPVWEEIDNLDSLPEEERTNYESHEGKYRRDITKDHEIYKGTAAKKGEVEKHLSAAQKQIKDIELAKQAEIAEATEKATVAALEKARKDGNSADEIRILKEQFEAERALLLEEKQKLESNYDKATRHTHISDVINSVEYAASSKYQKSLIEKDLLNNSVAISIDGDRKYFMKDAEGKASSTSVKSYFDSLVDGGALLGMLIGSKASGGGSNQSRGNNAGSNAKAMKRSDFQTLSHADRSKFMSGGGKLKD